MPSETMTPLERWLAVLNRQTPDRVPMDYQSTPEAHQKLKRYLRIADDQELYARLHIDRPLAVGGRYIGPPLPDDRDVFGIRYRDMPYEGGHYQEAIEYPLAHYRTVDEIKRNYRWPSPDWWDYSALPQDVRGWEEYPVNGGGSEPFLIYKNLRGQQQAFIDLVENPEMVHYCLDQLFELAYQNTLRIFEAIPGRVTFSYVAEDMGSQQPGFRLLENPHRGKPGAVWAGIQAARGEVVLFTDMDQSTPLDQFDKLKPKLDAGYDIAIGSRGLERENFPLYRRIGSIVFRGFRQLFILRHISDTQCGFKAFKTTVARDVFPQLDALRPKEVVGWQVTAFDVELLYLADQAGYSIAEVVVNWSNRDFAQHKNKSYWRLSPWVQLPSGAYHFPG